jgi:glycosyltransferase involved in cell wall biosynthesis
MKIGHFTTGIWLPGGVASYIGRVSAGQRRIGHEIVYLDTIEPIAGVADASKAVHYVQEPGELYSSAKALGVDILHVHTVLPVGAQMKLPTIRTVHGHAPYCPSGGRFFKRSGQPCNRNYSLMGCGWNHFAQRCGSVRPKQMMVSFQNTWQEMRTLRLILTVTVSHFLKAQMVRAGYPEENIHVLHLPAPDVKNCVPPPRDGVPRFLFLGRITPSKGVDWLLRAVQQVQTPIHVDIAGSGDLEPEMRRLSEQLGLSDRVTFHGWVDSDRVNELLSHARALVFPSVWHEPGGTVAFEAMVNGRAVVMSLVGGMPEVVHEGQNGLLVAPNDAPALARTIGRLAGDWELAWRLGEAGRKTAAEEFTLDAHVAHLMDLYANSIAGFSVQSGASQPIALSRAGLPQRETVERL